MRDRDDLKRIFFPRVPLQGVTPYVVTCFTDDRGIEVTHA